MWSSRIGMFTLHRLESICLDQDNTVMGQGFRRGSAIQDLIPPEASVAIAPADTKYVAGTECPAPTGYQVAKDAQPSTCYNQHRLRHQAFDQQAATRKGLENVADALRQQGLTKVPDQLGALPTVSSPLRLELADFLFHPGTGGVRSLRHTRQRYPSQSSDFRQPTSPASPPVLVGTLRRRVDDSRKVPPGRLKQRVGRRQLKHKCWRT